MDYFQSFVKQLGKTLFITMVFIGLATGIVVWVGLTFVDALGWPLVLLAAIAVLFGLSFWLSSVLSKKATEPLGFIQRAVLHVSPGSNQMLPPDINELKNGRELVTSMVSQVYQLAATRPTPAPANNLENPTQAHLEGNTVLTNFPLPIFVANTKQNITFTNLAGVAYLGKHQMSEVVGTNLYSTLDLSFVSDKDTFDQWLSECRASKVKAARTWEGAQLNLGEQLGVKRIDMAAYYNKNNPDGTEVVLVIFDKTATYNRGDDALNFVSLAVHELRTPLTMLRGYIEVFQEELHGKLEPELEDFMNKMEVASQQLSSFVSNILNVARVEENQLFLKLHETDWGKDLKQIISDMALRAQVHGKKIELHIQPNLPMAAVDAISMYEVIGNLIDNAIKYSRDNDLIIVRTYLNDTAQIETTIQDFGIGIPDSIIDKLFEKFYRSHRSRSRIGGTGLGLYLCKAIITAHGGNIWVKSKEGEGSTFGFTLQQYSQLAKPAGGTDNEGIQRVAHGWIKNHSFYKR